MTGFRDFFGGNQCATGFCKSYRQRRSAGRRAGLHRGLYARASEYHQ